MHNRTPGIGCNARILALLQLQNAVDRIKRAIYLRIVGQFTLCQSLKSANWK
jgi:hypothetical protein